MLWTNTRTWPCALRSAFSSLKRVYDQRLFADAAWRVACGTWCRPAYRLDPRGSDVPDSRDCLVRKTKTVNQSFRIKRLVRYIPDLSNVDTYGCILDEACDMISNYRSFYPAGIVTIGAPSLPPVSTRVKMNIRNENILFDGRSRSSILNQ